MLLLQQARWRVPSVSQHTAESGGTRVLDAAHSHTAIREAPMGRDPRLSNKQGAEQHVRAHAANANGENRARWWRQGAASFFLLLQFKVSYFYWKHRFTEQTL